MRFIPNILRQYNSLFFLMFGIVCLLNVNYAILRSARNALVVADLGGGAGSIPWFELCGSMPGSILMTLGLTWLLNRYPIQRVFFIALFLFIGFFLLFAAVIYPFLPACKAMILSWAWLPGSEAIASFFPSFVSMLFFVMAELWKIALLTVLFWGLMNQYVSLESAKSFYSPLMLGGSIGTLLAGPLISFCTSEWVSHKSWSSSLLVMMSLVALVGIATGGLFSALFRNLKEESKADVSKKEEQLSVWESLRVCFRSKYLMLLAWVTIADYVAYALGEVVFLDVLKQRYPDPLEYCDFMGTLSFWNGALTAISAVLITPYILRRCRWVVASLVTPICIVLVEGAFFFALWNPTLSIRVEWVIFLGSLFFCLVRAAKYTLFDTSKEISFLLLPPLEKMQGKLVVDGMCARVGRGGGSLLSIVLIQVFGSVLSMSPIAGLLAMVIATSCVLATSRLGALVDTVFKKRADLH